MNTRGHFNWSLILVACLLLASVSLAVAQDESQPAAPKAALAPTELGESASPVASLTETEPNGAFNSADPMQLGDVMSGKIGGPSDVDYFVVNVPQAAAVLIDIDAERYGSALDPVVCLYDKQRLEEACNDDADGLDSLIYHVFNGPNTTPGTPYYIKIRDYSYPNEGGATYTYKLLVYQPLLISAATAGTVAGIPFTNADVLSHYDFSDGTEKWMMFFDASDMGITKNLVGLATLHGDQDMDFALAANQNLVLGGATQVATPFDIIQFYPTPPGHFGPETAGEMYYHYRGRDYALSATSEKIDALGIPWTVSTTGAAVGANGLPARDEDVFNLPYGPTAYQWFDGSMVTGLAAEDVVGADERWNPAGYTEYLLTILGSGRVGGLAVTQKDIFTVNGSTYRVTGLYWHGPAHHFNYNIDAFDVGE